jgi:hypothetical protein
LASDPFLNEIMDEFGKKLNLAKHRVAKSDLLITGPTDIEAHYGI